MKIFIPLVFAVLLSSQPALSVAAEGIEPGQMIHHDPAALADLREQLTARLVEDLDLRIEQQAVLADIAADFGPRIAALMNTGADIGWSVLDVAPKNPQYSIDTDIAAQAAAEAAAEWVRTLTEFRNAVYSILSAQQIEQLEARLRARRDAWQEQLHNGSGE